MDYRAVIVDVVGMSILVWTMVGVAMWHFAVLVPDRFYGGIIGAFLAAVGGALIAGYLFPSPGVPDRNPPGFQEGLWSIPGALVGLGLSYVYGVRNERQQRS